MALQSVAASRLGFERRVIRSVPGAGAARLSACGGLPLRGWGDDGVRFAEFLGLTPPGYGLSPLRGWGDDGVRFATFLGLTPPGYGLSPLRGLVGARRVSVPSWG